MSNENIIICEWFATCDHAAVGTTPHPVLGDLPVCQRCADKLGLDVTPLPFCDECRDTDGWIDGPSYHSSGWCGDCFGGYPDSDEMHDVISEERRPWDAILDGVHDREYARLFGA
jgi:hypothetical protein